MRSVLVPIMIVAAITGFAGNLEDLKAASIRYVAAMEAVLAISDDSDCPGLVAKAIDYAAAKVTYYMAARKAMPALLQMATGQNTEEIDSRTFKARPSESNRIWIADKPLEEWIGAKVGRSRCDSVCGESKCRTVEGHEAVPEKLLLKAALIAASEMIRFSKIGWIAFFQKASPNTIPLTYYACRPQYEWLSRVQHDISAIG